MDARFVSLVERLLKERGQGDFLNLARCKSLLNDYTRNEYKKERHLLLLAIETGAAREIAKATDLAICRKIQVRTLKDDHFIDEAAAGEVIDLLALVLRGVRVSPPQTSPGLEYAAEQGDAATQFNLGVRYAKGQGVAQDHAEAVKWFRRAAEQGHADAQVRLAWIYVDGQGVARDVAEAIQWANKAVEQGSQYSHVYCGIGNALSKERKHAEAMSYWSKGAKMGDACSCVSIGRYYMTEIKDYPAAVYWNKLGGERGNAEGFNNLGYLYEHGLGIQQDKSKALTFYKMAIDACNEESRCDEAKERYSRLSAELAAAQPKRGKSFFFFFIAITIIALGIWLWIGTQENAESQYNRGREYAEKQDYVEAVKWYRKAADQGHASAQSNLGWMYAKGQGVAQDHVEADTWYRKAAEQGYAYAQYSLGVRYANGQGVAQDDMEAVKWYRKAAAQGYAYAQYSLGVRYANGQGVAQDDMEAVKWYRKAAEQGHAGAQNRLGWMYANGQGVARNDAEAVKWFRKAADQGHAGAHCGIGNALNDEQKYAEAISYWLKGAKMGDACSCVSIGWHYMTEIKNYPAAVYWNKLGGERGNAEGFNNLGYLYEHGLGVQQDKSKALSFYKMAMDGCYEESRCNEAKERYSRLSAELGIFP
jgi:TPR repeat protein